MKAMKLINRAIRFFCTPIELEVIKLIPTFIMIVAEHLKKLGKYPA